MSRTRKLIKVGSSKALTFSKDMQEHLGVSENVQVTYLAEGILLSRPKTIADAADLTEKRYDNALRELAK